MRRSHVESCHSFAPFPVKGTPHGSHWATQALPVLDNAGALRLCVFVRHLVCTVMQFARLWHLYEPLSEEECDDYLSILSKLQEIKGGPGEVITSPEGLQVLVSPSLALMLHV